MVCTLYTGRIKLSELEEVGELIFGVGFKVVNLILETR